MQHLDPHTLRHPQGQKVRLQKCNTEGEWTAGYAGSSLFAGSADPLRVAGSASLGLRFELRKMAADA